MKRRHTCHDCGEKFADPGRLAAQALIHCAGGSACAGKSHDPAVELRSPTLRGIFRVCDGCALEREHRPDGHAFQGFRLA